MKIGLLVFVILLFLSLGDMATSTTCLLRLELRDYYFECENGCCETGKFELCCDKPEESLSTGIIIGIGVASVLAFIIIVFGIVCVCKRFRKRPQKTGNTVVIYQNTNGAHALQRDKSRFPPDITSVSGHMAYEQFTNRSPRTKQPQPYADAMKGAASKSDFKNEYYYT